MTGPLDKKVAGKPKVIITEDEAHLRKLFKVMMVALNTDVVALASNGNEAVEFYRKARPHLMLLDINLPGKTGDEALAEIMAEFPHAFIIMLTSVSDLKTVKKCLDLGASNYILKDTPISEMKEIIKSTWKTRLEKMRERRLGTHQKPQAVSPPPPGTAPPQAARRRPGPPPGRGVPPQGGVPGRPGPPGPHPPRPPRPGSGAPNQRPPGRQPGPAGTGPGQPPPGRRPRPAGAGPGQPPPGRRPRPAGTGPGQPPPGRRPRPAGTGPGQPPPGRRPRPAGAGPGQPPPIGVPCRRESDRSAPKTR